MNRRLRYFDGKTADPKLRRIVKEAYSQKPARPVRSLFEESRFYYDGGGDGYTEYGFLPERFNAYDDDEIDEYIEDLREYVNSPYDCTGQRFTVWITWHRNPCGRISVIHSFGIDL